MNNSRSFTIQFRGITREIFIPSLLAPNSLPNTPFNAQSAIKYDKVLWDTGASASVISLQLAQDLQLQPIGVAQNITAGGTIDVFQYAIDILLPNNVVIKSLVVTACPLKDIDMLVGMDIISLGDFAVTHPNNMTKVSFQLPPTHDIDFALENKQS